MAEGQKLLTFVEVAELLSVKPDHLYELVKRGTIKAIHVGRLLRFRREEVKEFLERNLVGGVS